jgi:hypothetical protein
VARRLPNYTGCRGCFAFEAPPSPLCSIHLWQLFIYLWDARATHAQNKTKVFVYARVSHGDLKWTPCMRSCTYRWPHQGGWLFAPAMRDSCRVRSSPKYVSHALSSLATHKKSVLFGCCIARCGFVFTPRCNSIIFSLVRAYRWCVCIYTKVMYLFHLVDKQIFNNPNIYVLLLGCGFHAIWCLPTCSH